MKKKVLEFKDVLESYLNNYIDLDKKEEIVVLLSLSSHFHEIFGDL